MLEEGVQWSAGSARSKLTVRVFYTLLQASIGQINLVTIAKEGFLGGVADPFVAPIEQT